jgi:hypothetical protein
MQPFRVSASLDTLTSTYPTAEAVLDSARRGDEDTRYAIARLWLSEGIPFAFKDRPGVYEALRIWVARKLSIEAKQITLVGSARQGVSLQKEALGRPFGPKSDLDLSIISSHLFDRLATSFRQWQNDYAEGRISPRHALERIYWDENARIVPGCVARGFIDPHKVPTLNRYPDAQLVGQTLYEAHEKLKATRGAPMVRKISLRIYRDWNSFVRQCAINLEACARET